MRSEDESHSSSDDLLRWDRAAELYADVIGDSGGSFPRRWAAFLWQQLGDVHDLDVLDLGCGHGWLAAQVREAGANVVGVDGSAALVAAARARYPGVEFLTHHLVGGLPLPRRRYDRIVSHMVLIDVPELDELLADVAASLGDGGLFVFSILHPSFFGQPPARGPLTDRWERRVSGYLDHEQRWIDSFGGHTHYHRPLSWYVDVDLLARNDLAITALHEPTTLPSHTRPAEEWTEYEQWFSRIPTMLAMACRPASPGQGK